MERGFVATVLANVLTATRSVVLVQLFAFQLKFDPTGMCPNKATPYLDYGDGSGHQASKSSEGKEPNLAVSKECEQLAWNEPKRTGN